MGLIKEIQAFCDKEFDALTDERSTGDLRQAGYNEAIQHMVDGIEDILAPFQFSKTPRKNVNDTKKMKEKSFYKDVFKSIGIYPATFGMTVLLIDKEMPLRRRAEAQVKFVPGSRMSKKNIRQAIKECLRTDELKDFRVATPKEFAIWAIKQQIDTDLPPDIHVDDFPEKWPWEKSKKKGEKR